MTTPAAPILAGRALPDGLFITRGEDWALAVRPDDKDAILTSTGTYPDRLGGTLVTHLQRLRVQQDAIIALNGGKVSAVPFTAGFARAVFAVAAFVAFVVPVLLALTAHAITGVPPVIVDAGARAALLMVPIIAMGCSGSLLRYHGAEHQAVACLEDARAAGTTGLPTVEQVLQRPARHWRCGTNVAMLLMIVTTVTAIPLWRYPAWQHLLLTVPAGVAAVYLAGWVLRCKVRVLLKVVLWPGMQLQRITTAHAHARQAEVAVAAITALDNYRRRRDHHQDPTTLPAAA